MTVVERLAKQMDVSLDEADQRLDQLVEFVRQRLDEDGEVDLPGIGTFRTSDAGTVEFTATPSLTAVTNYRFGGLAPVQLPDDRTTYPPPSSDGPDAQSEDEEPSARSGNEELELPEPPESERLDEDVEQFWEEERNQSPLGSLPGSSYEDTSYSVVNPDAENETNTEQDEPSDSGRPDPEPMTEQSDEGDNQTEEEANAPNEKESAQTTFPRKPRSSQTSSRRTLSIIAVVLIATGAALLMYYAWSGDNITASSSSPPTAQTSEPPASSPEDPAASGEESPASANEQSSGSAQASGATPFDNPMQSKEGIAPEHGGHTWVVASLADQSTAEELHNTYASNGYRTSILRGGNGYRVAIGQFEAREAALATRGQLPSDVASAAWILEIQSNMSP